jgi:hypothetical protein
MDELLLVVNESNRLNAMVLIEAGTPPGFILKA